MCSPHPLVVNDSQWLRPHDMCATFTPWMPHIPIRLFLPRIAETKHSTRERGFLPGSRSRQFIATQMGADFCHSDCSWLCHCWLWKLLKNGQTMVSSHATLNMPDLV